MTLRPLDSACYQGLIRTRIIGWKIVQHTLRMFGASA